MPYNYSKLLGKIKERSLLQEKIAECIDTTPSTLSQKLNGKSQFKQEEILKVCGLLDIPPLQIGEYFFTEKV